MKSALLTFVLFTISLICFGQNKKDYTELDILLIRGNYKEVIEKCNELQLLDSLNPELFYKMGLAYQNLMNSEKCLEFFLKAKTLDTITIKYTFSLAKQYYLGGKWKIAVPMFLELSKADSLNWVFGYYLTDIYMQNNMFDKAMSTYEKFYLQDTLSPVFLDKMAFCSIKKGKTRDAMRLYEKSLQLKKDNILTIKNLSFIYQRTNKLDTAISLLTYAIKLDSTDMDLFQRRGDVFTDKNWHYQARPDYFRVLDSGDSSKVIYKKIGNSFWKNKMLDSAEKYLLSAYFIDSSDYEISHTLGQVYNGLTQFDLSIYYFKRVLKILEPTSIEINNIHLMLADTYKDSSLYGDAIKYYSKALDYKYSTGACLEIANIYDDKLKDYNNAIPYYQLFLNNYEKDIIRLDSTYIERVNKRLNWIVKNKNKRK